MVHSTEEEQVEALKNWWRENGTAILTGIVLALAAVFGWQGWQKQQQAMREGSSVLYQNLMDAYVNATGGEAEATDLSTLDHLAQQMREEYPRTTYAVFAAMHMARFHVINGDLDKARAELEWATARNPDAALADVVRLRLAQVLFAQGEGQQALKLLEQYDGGAQAVSYAELRGDILFDLERVEDAGEAYREAMELAELRGERRPILEMKIQDLARTSEET